MVHCAEYPLGVCKQCGSVVYVQMLYSSQVKKCCKDTIRRIVNQPMIYVTESTSNAERLYH